MGHCHEEYIEYYLIQSVGGNLEVFINNSLTSLQDLENLGSVGGTLEVYSNPLLATCEAEWLEATIGLEHIAGEIRIENNDDTGTCVD